MQMCSSTFILLSDTHTHKRKSVSSKSFHLPASRPIIPLRVQDTHHVTGAIDNDAGFSYQQKVPNRQPTCHNPSHLISGAVTQTLISDARAQKPTVIGKKLTDGVQYSQGLDLRIKEFAAWHSEFIQKDDLSSFFKERILHLKLF